MAAFKSTFNAAGSGDCEVITSSFSFTRTVATTGFPTSELQGGIIDVTIVASEKKSLFEWMLNSTKQESGTITYMDPTQKGAKLKTLSFQKAYCVGYKESFDARGSATTVEAGAATQASFIISLRISAGQLDVDGSTYQPIGAGWPESNS